MLVGCGALAADVVDGCDAACDFASSTTAPAQCSKLWSTSVLRSICG